MRVLWICKVITPEYSDIYKVKKRHIEGWISGMHRALADNSDMDIACCFSIIDEVKMIKGKSGKLTYYSYHSEIDTREVDEEAISEFCAIYEDYKPDIIHIWGSEYPHSYAAALAAERVGLLKRVVLHVQGLISAIAPYYSLEIPDKWIDFSCNNIRSIREEASDLERRGKYEIELIKSGITVLGRTSWDKAYIESLSSNVHYRLCDEILRSDFYDNTDRWKIERARKHTAFISQAYYPIKGLHFILSSVAKLKQEYNDFHLFISGGSGLIAEDSRKQSPYEQYILSLIQKYKIEDVITFTGTLDSMQMIKMFLECNVFICPSTIENSSNSIGEAQLLGVPVVASYTGGTPDLITHGETGLMYQMDSDYMFMSCIKRVFDDDAFATRMSVEEQRVASERYNRDRIKKQLLTIYEELIENNLA
ncbi:Glycosyltransferase involved in cell wall bisynthesis [Butyrivibrio sp. INlla18]|uniref:glycosyltransferase family 4 protein n=1 Tax=Butyrivibrio sp. INlla18 TaxID=1520806 RepID=UPI00088BDFB4|nr:glycosyltransferase [Butyrivibrio sp. INlla18]SDA41629.1 Glycosyltransferase involved in cell wall bisynthesis [Butyrivibrio sp. INlla18]